GTSHLSGDPPDEDVIKRLDELNRNHPMTIAPLHPVIERVTRRIEERSATSRATYLASVEAQRKTGTQRSGMGCANMAHTTAALPANDKLKIHAERAPHVGIVTA